MSENSIATANKTLYDQVLNKVNGYRANGELSLPMNYSPENAMKSAQLVISEVADRNKRPALEVCTRASIAQALLDTIIQGLNPGKKQCYYIVYGDKLVMQRSRYGEEHLAMSVCPEIEGIYPNIVYKDDVFEYGMKRGRTVIEKHTQSLGNIKPDKIIAAYCTIVYRDGHEETTIMTIDEVYAAWRKSKQSPFDDNGKLKSSSTHGQYTAEMAKKTVVRRACKPIINSSDDSNLITQSVYRTDDAARDNDTDSIIADNNGVDEVDFTESTVVDVATGEVIEQPVDESDPY